ncbi:cysteine dioxygenase [Dyella terrae]|uniref:Cysteine dioxygenase n=3 Tax=Rhodanobacteraceae TaxID=1775411 RepID=A0A4V2NM47_9GAMM|nr:cysteine dioxygenase [Dyella terrae]TCI11917.1 cysteine dioxygenase [Dyella soli]
MSQHMHTLKALRDIAYDLGANERPDLASMAREMGRVIHQQGRALNDGLAPLRKRQRGFERWLVGQRSKVSLLVMVWPANHSTPVHDHGGLWGLELALQGALEVQSWSRDDVSGELTLQGQDWLGPGDATWFEADGGYAHRCRNLSRHEAALTLHVYGGNLAQYLAYEPAARDKWLARPQRAAIAGHLGA